MVRVFVVPRFEGEGFLREWTGLSILQRHLKRELKLQPVGNLEGLVRRARRRAANETVVALLSLEGAPSSDRVDEVLGAVRALACRAPKILPVVVIGGEGPAARHLIGRLTGAGAAEVVVAGEEDAPEALAQRLQALLLGEPASELLDAIPPQVGATPRLLAGRLVEEIAAGQVPSDEEELADLCGWAHGRVHAVLEPIGGFELLHTCAALHLALEPEGRRERTRIAEELFGSWPALQREWEGLVGCALPDAAAEARRALLERVAQRFRSPPQAAPMRVAMRPPPGARPPEDEREAHAAFARFRDAIWDRALVTAERILGPGPEASDAASHVVGKTFLRDAQPPTSEEQAAYILRAVKNAALDERAKLDSEPLPLDEVPEGSVSCTPTPELGEEERGPRRHQVDDALGRIDDSRATTAFYLADRYGVPPAQVATNLGVGRRRIEQLRKAVRDELTSILEGS